MILLLPKGSNDFLGARAYLWADGFVRHFSQKDSGDDFIGLYADVKNRGDRVAVSIREDMNIPENIAELNLQSATELWQFMDTNEQTENHN